MNLIAIPVQQLTSFPRIIFVQFFYGQSRQSNWYLFGMTTCSDSILYLTMFTYNSTEILKFGVSKCCGSHTPSCWTISHGQPKNLTEDTFLETSQSHIVYPIIVDTNNDANTKKSVIGKTVTLLPNVPF